jgi:hypothetical protein
MKKKRNRKKRGIRPAGRPADRRTHARMRQASKAASCVAAARESHAAPFPFSFLFLIFLSLTGGALTSARTSARNQMNTSSFTVRFKPDFAQENLSDSFCFLTPPSRKSPYKYPTTSSSETLKTI